MTINNQDIKNIAEKVLSKVPNDEPEKFGSVILIVMIISVILTLIRVIQECDKSKIKLFNRKQKYDYFGGQIKTLSVNRGWFSKMTIKKILRKELSKEDYKKYGISLMLAILDTGERLTDEEIITLVEASNV